ncbi:MAG: hypothetical protein ACE5IK_12530 [Acidobacteriota bacterium]
MLDSIRRHPPGMSWRLVQQMVVVTVASFICPATGWTANTVRPAPPAAARATAGQPDRLSADWWRRARREITASEYQSTWQSQTRFDDLKAAWQAPDRAQGFRTYFTPRASGSCRAPRRR